MSRTHAIIQPGDRFMYFLVFLMGMALLVGFFWLLSQLLPYLIGFAVLTVVVIGGMYVFSNKSG